MVKGSYGNMGWYGKMIRWNMANNMMWLLVKVRDMNYIIMYCNVNLGNDDSALHFGGPKRVKWANTIQMVHLAWDRIVQEAWKANQCLVQDQEYEGDDGWVLERSNGWLIVWLVGWLVVGWSVDWLGSWLIWFLVLELLERIPCQAEELLVGVRQDAEVATRWPERSFAVWMEDRKFVDVTKSPGSVVSKLWPILGRFNGWIWWIDNVTVDMFIFLCLLLRFHGMSEAH